MTIYGIEQEAYTNEDEMFQLVHEMRSRIMKSPNFTKERILAAILFEKTMDLKVDGKYTADYLWETKGILAILKNARLNQPIKLKAKISCTNRFKYYLTTMVTLLYNESDHGGHLIICINIKRGD